MSETGVVERTGTASGGFSLLEVMIALSVLGFGLLTLSVMQIEALRQGNAGRHTSDAAAVGRSYLEQAHRLPWSVLTTAQASGTWTAPGWAGLPNSTTSINTPGGGGVVAENTYTVLWSVTDVGSAPSCLRDVHVEISWNEENMSTAKQTMLSTRRYNWGDPSC
ncbi:MAG: prepilin-type N-terminal cleavage/methylation domain-containing protein [Myxococcota bacterium]